MRNPILVMAIAFALAAPCTALAGEKNKEKYIESQGYSWGTSNAGSLSKSTGASPKLYQSTAKGVHYPDAILTTRTAPVGGSTGPTKPPLPTTGTQHR